MPIYPILSSFTGGEVAPSLYARVDLERYMLSLKKARNVMVMPHGGLRNRPGTSHCGDAFNVAYKSRLVNFVVGLGSNYILEFSEKKIQIWKDCQKIHELSTNYSAADIFNLKFVQSVDVMYICNREYPFATLSRYAEDDWRLEAYDISPVPMEGPYTGKAKLKMSATPPATGKAGETVTLTSDINFFDSTWVGRWLRIDWTRNEESIVDDSHDSDDTPWYSTPWEVNGNWEFHYRFDATGRGPFRLQYSTDGGTIWQQWRVIQENTAWQLISGELRPDADGVRPLMRLVSIDGDTNRIYYNAKNLREDRVGYVKITAFTDAKNVTCVVEEDTQVTDGRPIHNFQLGAFYGDNHSPDSVGFFEDRLGLALDERIWLSDTSDYPKFSASIPEVDTDSISMIAATRRVNEVRHILGLRTLVIFGSEGEFVASAANNAGLTNKTKTIKQESYRGASPLPPIPVGNIILYTQAHGSTVRSLGYSFDVDGYTGSDLSILAKHLFDGHKIVDWAYQQEPDSIIWAVRDDGKVLSLTYMVEHQITAWALHDFGGNVESIASIPGDEQDEVYMTVRRTINGTEKLFIEKLMKRFEYDDTGDKARAGYFVDCGKVFHYGAPQSTITGLDHLEGESVSVLADGKHLQNVIVSGGSITLLDPASTVHVGLPYVSQIQTLEVNFSTPMGTSVSRKKCIAAATIRVNDTIGGEIGPTFDKLTDLRRLLPRQHGAVDLFSGDVIQPMKGGFSEGGTICLQQTQPYPLELLAIIPHVDYAN